MAQSATSQFSNDAPPALPRQAAAADTAGRADGAETTLEASRISLLTEVDFKWLMAGQGWHVDGARFHNDVAYARTLLRLALESNCPALRDCANNILEASQIIQP